MPSDLSVVRFTIIGLLILCPILAFAQCWPRSQKLVPTKALNTAEAFGASIDYENNIAVVGAPSSDTLRTSSGVVYVFEFKDDTWSKIASLTPSDHREYQGFGLRVLIQDDQIFVSDPARKEDPGNTSTVFNQGAVYVYDKPAGGWHDMVETSVITPVHPSIYAFASSMDVYQNRLLVGASYTTNENGVGTGAAFMFERQGNNWIQIATFKTPHTLTSNFGSNVALAENMAVVVASEEYLTQNFITIGATYVFEKNSGSSWTDAYPLARLTESSGDETISYLGTGLEIDELRKTIFITKVKYGVTQVSRTINVYEKPGSGWASMTETFTYQTASLSQVFYQTLRFEEPYLYYGGPTNVEIFVPGAGGHWTVTSPVSQLKNSNFNIQQQFGYDLCVSNGRVLVSTPSQVTFNRDEPVLPASPAIYDFQKPGAGWLPGLNAEARSFTYMPTTATDFFFGVDVDIDGDIAVVGSPYDNAMKNGSGVAYVYRLNNNVWNKIAVLSPSDGEPFDHFGLSVSISEDHIAVGSDSKPLRDAAGKVIDFDLGAVYIFKRPSAGWTDMSESFKIIKSEGKIDGNYTQPDDDHFGMKVALDYPTLVVSRYDNGSRPNTGFVFVYNIGSGSAVLEATLTPSTRENVNNFGQSISIRDSVIAVGVGLTGFYFLEQNAVYMYERHGPQWKNATESGLLVPSDDGATGYLPGIAFGTSIDMTDDGSQIIVGAPGWYDGIIFQTTDYFKGAAYIYTRPSNGWKGRIKEQARLTIPNQPAYGCMGTAVHIEDRYAVVGSPQNYFYTNGGQNPGPGKAFFYQKPDDGWKYKLPDKIIQGDESGSQLSDYFGASLDGVFGYLMIGATADDNQNSVDAGSVYVYTEYPFINPAPSPVCENASPMQLTAFPGNGVWSGNGMTNPTDGIFDPSRAGAGTHKISYKVDGCDAANTLLIRVKEFLGTFSLIGNDSLFFCGNRQVKLEVPFKEGYTYEWFYSQQGQSYGGRISEQSKIDADKTGYYKIAVTNDCGNAGDVVWVGDIFPDAGSDFEICLSDAVIQLAGNYSSGTWTGPGVSLSGQLDLRKAGAGLHEISYVVSPAPGCPYKDAIKVQISPPKPVTILPSGADTFCYTGQAMLSATVIPNAKYTWYFGENPNVLSVVGNDAKFIADKVGYYKVVMSDALCLSDNSYYLFLPQFKPEVLPKGNAISFCQDDPLTIKAESIAGADYKLFEYINSTPVLIQENTGSFSEIVRESGKFTLRIESHGCVFQSNDLEVDKIPGDSLFVPNVFTPNGDQYNEHFDVFTEGIAAYSLRVFNRAGQEVWSGQNGTSPWNGGNAAPGVYYWMISYESRCSGIKNAKGWVQVMK